MKNRPKLSLKLAWLGSRDPLLHAQLRTLKKFRQGTPLTEINNAVVDGALFFAPDTSTLRLRLRIFDFLCICCKLDCVVRPQQMNQVEFEYYEPCMYVLITDRRWSV